MADSVCFCAAGERDQGICQVPAEEGAVPGRGHRKCGHGGEGDLCQLPDERQLPGVAAEEELAERPLPLHQVEHGQALQALLSNLH